MTVRVLPTTHGLFGVFAGQDCLMDGFSAASLARWWAYCKGYQLDTDR